MLAGSRQEVRLVAGCLLRLRSDLAKDKPPMKLFVYWKMIVLRGGRNRGRKRHSQHKIHTNKGGGQAEEKTATARQRDKETDTEQEGQRWGRVEMTMRMRKRAKRDWQAMRLGDNPNVNLKPPNGLWMLSVARDVVAIAVVVVSAVVATLVSGGFLRL